MAAACDIHEAFPPRVICGARPTQAVHLGHVFGAFEDFRGLQVRHPGETFALIADLHALDARFHRRNLELATHELTSAWLALGLDPRRTLFYRQSDVPAVMELALVLAHLVSVADIERVPAVRAAGPQRRTAGSLLYPVVMAADILGPRATVVAAGRDQIAHVEFARRLARRANRALEEVVFPLPQTRRVGETVIPGTDGRKMCGENGIRLFAPVSELQERIRGIVTATVGATAPKDPDCCTVARLHALVSTTDRHAELREDYRAGLSFEEAKRRLLLAIVEFRAPFEERYHSLRAEPDTIDDLLHNGAAAVREEAEKTLERILALAGMTGGKGM